MVLGRISERLDATPAQERVIDEVMDSVRRVGESFRSELEKTREAAAKAARAESFDATALREAWARHDALIAEFRAAVVDGLRKVHEALQPRQRQTLAELVEGGWRGFARGGRRCGGFAGHSQQHRPYGDGYAA